MIGRRARALAALLLPVLPGCLLLTDLSGLEGVASSDAADAAPRDRSGDDGPSGSDAGDAAAEKDSGSVPGADSGTDADAGPVCTRGAVGTKCDGDDQCCSASCYLETCRGNEVGSKCRSDENCTSKSCYLNECRGNGPGSKCGSDEKCTSNNCYLNTCQ